MTEYGSSEEPETLAILRATFPLHNIRRDPAIQYPAMLITTSHHDTRVVPCHSLKLLEELQSVSASSGNASESIIVNLGLSISSHSFWLKKKCTSLKQELPRCVFSTFYFFV